MARLKTVYILYSAPWGLACSLINDSRVVSKTHAKRAAAIDSCLPLTLKMPDHSSGAADPEGAAQDVRRFPTEPWMASRKIARKIKPAS
jgi:hypothetical protein